LFDAEVNEILDLHNTERALRASELSILETKKALEEQHAIGRLTQLASIFLPITFITGIFGMNVKMFSERAPIWSFWVKTCPMLFPSWFFGLWTAKSDIKRNSKQSQDKFTRERRQTDQDDEDPGVSSRNDRDPPI
jgi:CorA-like Mg2+ transporter protein